MNCIKLNEACLYRMECDSSLCKISYCQKSFDDIIILLGDILKKIEPVGMQSVNSTSTIKPINPHAISEFIEERQQQKTQHQKRRGRPKGK
jgi:hypothetical protein